MAKFSRFEIPYDLYTDSTENFFLSHYSQGRFSHQRVFYIEPQNFVVNFLEGGPFSVCLKSAQIANREPFASTILSESFGTDCRCFFHCCLLMA